MLLCSSSRYAHPQTSLAPFSLACSPCKALLSLSLSLSHPNNIDDAVSSFMTILNKRNPPFVVEFNMILGSILKMKQYPIAVSLVAHSETRGITRSMVTLSILINCFCHLGQMDFAFSVLGKMGHELNVIILTTIMKGFCINSETREALEFRDRVRALGYQLNEVSYGTLINGLCKMGQSRAAVELLQKLKRQPVKPNVVMYSTIIDGLSKDGLITEADSLFSEMIAWAISPDVVTYSSLIHGFGCVSQLEEATRLLNEMLKNGTESNIYTFSILIHALCKEERLREAQNVFDRMLEWGDGPML